jgi:hypothetical protein
MEPSSQTCIASVVNYSHVFDLSTTQVFQAVNVICIGMAPGAVGGMSNVLFLVALSNNLFS